MNTDYDLREYFQRKYVERVPDKRHSDAFDRSRRGLRGKTRFIRSRRNGYGLKRPNDRSTQVSRG